MGEQHDRDGPKDLVADFVATVNGERENFDVEVTTISYDRMSIRWPTPLEIYEAMEVDKLQGPALPLLFFWEDRSFG